MTRVIIIIKIELKSFTNNKGKISKGVGSSSSPGYDDEL